MSVIRHSVISNCAASTLSAHLYEPPNLVRCEVFQGTRPERVHAQQSACKVSVLTAIKLKKLYY